MRVAAGWCRIAEHMVSGLGGGNLIRWDECDPLATPRDLDALTASLRQQMPLATLLGPTVVRDLRIDVEEISRTHDVTPVGLRKAPGLLVRFSRSDDFWHQMVAFTHDLGQERLAAALAGAPVDRRGKERI